MQSRGLEVVIAGKLWPGHAEEREQLQTPTRDRVKLPLGAKIRLRNVKSSPLSRLWHDRWRKWQAWLRERR
jgi:hypothetical protein